jgi:hypothetical protein
MRVAPALASGLVSVQANLQQQQQQQQHVSNLQAAFTLPLLHLMQTQ